MTYIIHGVHGYRGAGGLGDDSKKAALLASKNTAAIKVAQAAGADVSGAIGQAAAQKAWDAAAAQLRATLTTAAAFAAGGMSVKDFNASTNPIVVAARQQIEAKVVSTLGPRPQVVIPTAPLASKLPAPNFTGASSPVSGGGDNTMLYLGGAAALLLVVGLASKRGG